MPASVKTAPVTGKTNGRNESNNSIISKLCTALKQSPKRENGSSAQRNARKDNGDNANVKKAAELKNDSDDECFQAKYFDELQWELSKMYVAEQNPLFPLSLPHARSLLVREILRLRQKRQAATSPRSAAPTTQSQKTAESPQNELTSDSGQGSDRSPQREDSALQSEHLGKTTLYKDGVMFSERRWKVFIPEHPTYNFIGRILGPRGISVRRLEAETGCTVFIRGKGCIKDAKREQNLHNTAGWEHLSEPLHVLVVADDVDDDVCKQKLEMGSKAIEKLLKPRFDEYKRQQLLQLAIITGNYRPSH